jgi:hypothetical protein
LCILIAVLQSAHAQNPAPTKFNVRFSVDSIRLKSDSRKSIDTSITILLPARPAANSKGKIMVEAEDTKSLPLEKLKVPLKNSFEYKNATDSLSFSYPVTFPRDMSDDKFLYFRLKAFDDKGNRIPIDHKDSLLVVYIKPYTPDSLSSNQSFELWFFTGTNLDPFEGVKPQEFFFRMNTLFKVNDHFFGQIAIYNNRYFTQDSTRNSKVFQFGTPPYAINGNDTTFRYVTGTYGTNISQKTDALGLQLDALFKLKENDENGKSTFFGSLGIDVSTRKTTVTTKYFYDTSLYLRSTRVPRDTPTYALPIQGIPFSFRQPVYNLSVGLFWIFENDLLNVKTHLTGGWSKATITSFSITPTRGGGNSINYTPANDWFFQLRSFATLRKIGLSVGAECFVKRNFYPQFNFTVSKVFELQNFLSLFSPVSSLKK